MFKMSNIVVLNDSYVLWPAEIIPGVARYGLIVWICNPGREIIYLINNDN